MNKIVVTLIVLIGFGLSQTSRKLPDAKLKDSQAALGSVRRLTEHTQIQTVLVGDGWHLFGNGHQELCDLVKRLEERISA